jgi:hypothetical protein
MAEKIALRNFNLRAAEKLANDAKMSIDAARFAGALAIGTELIADSLRAVQTGSTEELQNSTVNLLGPDLSDVKAR